MTVFKQLLNDYKQCLLRGDHSDGVAAYLALVDEYEKAARRAPAAPVPQGWKLVPDANNMTDEQAEAICNLVSCCGGGAHEVYEAALAAAPQPPEADMGIPISAAAPVQMPEPFTTLVRKNSWSTNCYEASPLSKHRDYGRLWADERVNVYTEQQVRDLLAANGIEVSP